MVNQYPTDIKKGLGRLTPEVLNNVFEAVTWIEENKRDLESVIGNMQKHDSQLLFFLAKITGSWAYSSTLNQWVYDWTAQSIGNYTDTTDYEYAVTDTLGLESDASTRALNVMEIVNTDELVGPGIDTTTNYPSGFSVKPVCDGAIVMMFWNKMGSGVPVFCVENAHQGSC